MKMYLSALAACALLGGITLGIGCSDGKQATENTGRHQSAACDGQDEYQESDGSWVVCVYIEDDEPIEPPFTNPPGEDDGGEPPPEPPPTDPSGGGEPPPEACWVTLHSCSPWSCVDNGQCDAETKRDRCDSLSSQSCGPTDHCNHCRAQYQACDAGCAAPPLGDLCEIGCTLDFVDCRGSLTPQQCTTS